MGGACTLITVRGRWGFRQCEEQIDDLEVAQLLDVLNIHHAQLVCEQLGMPLHTQATITWFFCA
jgi:hypothetical protein